MTDTELRPCAHCGGAMSWCGDLEEPEGCLDPECTYLICLTCRYHIHFDDTQGGLTREQTAKKFNQRTLTEGNYLVDRADLEDAGKELINDIIDANTGDDE